MPQCQVFTAQQIASFRCGGEILRACLEHVAALVEAGITTQSLDAAAETFIRDHSALPAFKGYRNYPSTLCVSVNEECVHGLPGPRTLKEGDVVSLDCGVLLDGLYTDACVTVGVGQMSAEAQKLLDVTERALEAAVQIVRAGVKVGDISSTVQKTVEREGCTPVAALTGHGLGKTLHQFPDIPNVGRKGTGPVLPANTVVAIEPIITLGDGAIQDTEDGWTLVTRDGALAAHFEHTILVTKEGCEVLA